MDACEATKIVMARIKELDMENTSKILGHILLQAQGEKEVIRLAFAPESLLQSCVNQSKACLGLLPSSSEPSTHFSNAFPQTSPRIFIPNHAVHFHNPSSPSASFTRNGPASLHSGDANSFHDEFLYGAGTGDGLQHQVHEYSSLVDDFISDPINSQNGIPHPHSLYSRSSSVRDADFQSNLEFGWKPCMYFTRGACKNGESCRFSHDGIGNRERLEVGSPGMDSSGFDEFLRSKAQQLRLEVLTSGGHHPFPHKYMDLQEENKWEDLSSIGLCAGASSSARQIYLTFPADSTFKEENVAEYFNTFGPVQDVRIPYQQRRMFGFVTFVYSETVKRILAKGNPHFIRDSRVLVKPYKEKGKLPERKYYHQQMDRRDYTSCLSPSLSDSIEQLDIPFGPRMLLNAQEKILRRRLEEQEELHNAIELQGEKMTNLHLMDPQDQRDTRHFHSSLLADLPFPSPRQSWFPMEPNEFDNGQEASKTI